MVAVAEILHTQNIHTCYSGTYFNQKYLVIIIWFWNYMYKCVWTNARTFYNKLSFERKYIL